ncbi:lipocalin [uncultured Tateyamaria sp.]|uniref:lipocalin n=1 Tax=uncultured Tateyamaria sp. TaxID=455651 RepID=UPI002634A4AF|nr:lipocalin [uncultured Tateyamaria sp.]
MIASVSGWGKRAVWMGAMCVLSACAVPPPETPSFRTQSAPIGVTTRFDGDRMSGDWFVRGALPGDETVQAVNFITLDALPTMVVSTNEGNGLRKTVWRGRERQSGRYEFRPDEGTVSRDLVVIWVDQGFRTAAIGDPAGRFAWVLDRAPTGGADRITAARKVLVFSGFDLSKMVTRP